MAGFSKDYIIVGLVSIILHRSITRLITTNRFDIHVYIYIYQGRRGLGISMVYGRGSGSTPQENI